MFKIVIILLKCLVIVSIPSNLFNRRACIVISWKKNTNVVKRIHITSWFHAIIASSGFKFMNFIWYINIFHLSDGNMDIFKNIWKYKNDFETKIKFLKIKLPWQNSSNDQLVSFIFDSACCQCYVGIICYEINPSPLTKSSMMLLFQSK